MNTLKSNKSVKWTAIQADWKDPEGLLESLQKTLKRMGVTMVPAPCCDGCDEYGYILSTSKLTKKQIKEIDKVLMPNED